jgi:hypothetical protein
MPDQPTYHSHILIYLGLVAGMFDAPDAHEHPSIEPLDELNGYEWQAAIACSG